MRGLLADEGQVAIRNVNLVTEMQLIRYQRRQYRTLQGQILGLWNQYARGEVSATGLLKKIPAKHKPAVTVSDKDTLYLRTTCKISDKINDNLTSVSM